MMDCGGHGGKATFQTVGPVGNYVVPTDHISFCIILLKDIIILMYYSIINVVAVGDII